MSFTEIIPVPSYSDTSHIKQRSALKSNKRMKDVLNKEYNKQEKSEKFINIQVSTSARIPKKLITMKKILK